VRGEVGDPNALSNVVVGGWYYLVSVLIWLFEVVSMNAGVVLTYFDNFVTRKFEIGNVASITGHEVAVEDSKDGLVRDQKEIVLFTFELKDDWFETHG